MTTFTVEFPSIHANTRPFKAEAEASTYAAALRSVLEYAASEGIALEYVRLTGIESLAGACLDGLQLIGCTVHQCNLQDVSLKGASIADTVFENVFADASTKMNGATLDAVRFVNSKIDGLSLKATQLRAVRFEFTSARGLDLADATVTGLRHIRSDLAGLRAPMAYLSMVEGVEGLLAASAMTANEVAAVRTLATQGSRLAAQVYFDELEAQANA